MCCTKLDETKIDSLAFKETFDDQVLSSSKGFQFKKTTKEIYIYHNYDLFFFHFLLQFLINPYFGYMLFYTFLWAHMIHEFANNAQKAFLPKKKKSVYIWCNKLFLIRFINKWKEKKAKNVEEKKMKEEEDYVRL